MKNQKSTIEELEKRISQLEQELEIERERLQNAAVECEKKANAIYERITDAFAAFDKNWRYTYINKKAADILNRKPEDLIGKNVWEEFPESVGLPFQIAFFKAMDTQEYVYLEEYYPPLNKWYENHIYPSPEGLTVYMRDTTEKNLAIQSLKNKIKLMNDVMDISSSLIYITDIKGKFISVNNELAKLFGKSADDIIGQTRESFMPEEIAAQHFSNDMEVFNSGKATLREEEHIAEGFKHYYLTSKFPLFDVQNNIYGVCGISTDITEQQKTQTSLIKSENRFQNLFQNHSVVKLIIDPENGNIVEANNAAASFYGWTVGELKNMNIAQINTLQPAAWEKVTESVLALKKTSYEFKHRKANGSLVDVEVFSSNVDIEGKQFIHNIILDISEKKTAKDELFIQQQLLASVMDTQQELICRFLPDTTLTFVNKAYCKIFYKTEIELLGRKFLELVPESEWEGVFSNLKKLNKENRQITYEAPALKPDGSVMTLEWTDIAIFNEEGEVVEFQSVGHDITEKLKAEQEIIFHSQMQSVLRTIASTFINIPLELIDREIQSSLEQLGRFVRADRVYIFDYDWVNHTCSNTFEWCNDGIEPQIDYMQNVPLDEFPQWVSPHKLGKALNIPDVLKLPENDGVRKILESQGILSLLTIPVMHNDLCVGFIGFDAVRKQYAFSESEEKFLFLYSQQFISVKNRQILKKSLIIAKEKAEESNRLKSAFLANMSHEIRTPMNGILGFAGLLKEPELTGEQQQDYIDIIEKSGARMLNIINDIISISKIESGIIEVYNSEMNVNEQLRFVYDFLKPDADSKNLTLILTSTLPDKEAIINTDSEKLYSILSNLVKNAIKYTDSGNIAFGYHLKTGKHKEELEFFIKDKGIGIPKDRQEDIFERFIQADIEDKMAKQGAGLGLAIARAYVEMLGGKIWVESEPGSGSIFYFTLPYNHKSKEKPVERSPITNQNDKIISKLFKILIVEDDETSAELYEIMVDDLSKEVLFAKDGLKAVNECRQNPDIDLILMDIQMPVLNGYKATQQIREFNKDVIIIAQTAFALTGDKEKALEAGCNDYISKPISQEKLTEIILKHLKDK